VSAGSREFCGFELLRVIVVRQDPERADLRIQTVELYADGVTVRWVRLAPEGRRQDRQSSIDRSPFTLVDDLGTAYRLVSGQSGGAEASERGHWDYMPQVPTQATSLTIAATDWSLPIQLDAPTSE
jgi:hypothetical protein